MNWTPFHSWCSLKVVGMVLSIEMPRWETNHFNNEIIEIHFGVKLLWYFYYDTMYYSLLSYEFSALPIAVEFN